MSGSPLDPAAGAAAPAVPAAGAAPGRSTASTRSDGPAGSGDADATVEVAVARVLRAHGVRGHLAVLPLTDEPEDRLAAGRVLTVETPTAGLPVSLEVLRSVVSADRVLLSVAEVTDRDAAERLRGAVLTALVPVDRSPADPEEFYDHQLLGLAVVDTAGAALGTVSGVTHGAQDLLVVTTAAAGPPVLVPFVAALVPVVDPAGGRVVVDPPPGLFDAATGDPGPDPDSVEHGAQGDEPGEDVPAGGDRDPA